MPIKSKKELDMVAMKSKKKLVGMVVDDFVSDSTCYDVIVVSGWVA